MLAKHVQYKQRNKSNTAPPKTRQQFKVSEHEVPSRFPIQSIKHDALAV